MAEFVQNGAKMHCTYGSKPGALKVPNRGSEEGAAPAAFKGDCKAQENIPDFGMCSSEKGKSVACTLPLVGDWQATEGGMAYRKKSAEYNNACKQFNSDMKDFLDRGSDLQYEVERAAELYQEKYIKYGSKIWDNTWAEYPFWESYSQIREALWRYGNSLTRIKALGASEGQQFEDGQSLYGHKKYYDMLTNSFFALALYWKELSSALPKHVAEPIHVVKALAEMMNNSFNTVVASFTLRNQLDEALMPLEETERLTKNSKLFCSRKGVIEFDTTKARSVYDIHNLIEKEIGVCRSGNAWQSIIVRLVNYGDLCQDMTAQYDSETELHFLVSRSHIQLVIVTLGICAPELYEQVEEKYIYLSVEEMLLLANVQFSVLREGGYWNIAIYPTQTAEKVALAVAEAQAKAKAEAEAKKKAAAQKPTENGTDVEVVDLHPLICPLPIVPFPGGFIQAGINGSVNVRAPIDILIKTVTEAMELFTDAVDERITKPNWIFDFGGSGQNPLSISLEYTDKKETTHYMDLCEPRNPAGNVMGPKRESDTAISAGPDRIGASGAGGSVSIGKNDGSLDAIILSDAGVGVALEGEMPGLAFRIGSTSNVFNIEVKIYYYGAYIKIACTGKGLDDIRAGRVPIGNLEPYFNIYFLRLPYVPEAVRSLLPRAHYAWADILLNAPDGVIITAAMDLQMQLQYRVFVLNGNIDPKQIWFALGFIGILLLAVVLPAAIPVVVKAAGVAHRVIMTSAQIAAIKAALQAALPKLSPAAIQKLIQLLQETGALPAAFSHLFNIPVYQLT